MNVGFKRSLLASVGLWVVLLAVAGCESSPSSEPDIGPDDGTAAQSRAGSVVTGTVTYRERITLSPGAVLEVELRDVSLQDVASTLVARQVISNLGQVPIPFRIEYGQDNVKPGNTYTVQARINYGDGSLAFINDTAYEVITQGRPNKVDMVLVMVGPPPETDAPPDSAPTVAPGSLGWVEVPTPIRAVRVEKYAEGYLLTATYVLPGDSDCSLHSSVVAELVGMSIRATVNNLERRDKGEAPGCASGPREGQVGIPIEGPFAPGETYTVRVNGAATNAFTPPRKGLQDSTIALSPIEKLELQILEIFPPQYVIQVVSGLPKGSGCSQFNGYDIERSAPGRIVIMVTHHEVVAKDIACVEDYPTVETAIPLGKDFEPGRRYAVYVNGAPLTFQAQ